MDEKTDVVEREGLLEQVMTARADVAEVLLETDDVTLQQIPQIVTEWECTIGVYQTDLLKAQIAARRARRRLELAQARANRGDDPDATAIEQVLDREFESWRHEIEERTKKYLAAVEKRQGSRVLTATEGRELQRLHRELIKRLHPDVNPGEQDTCLRLFRAAQNAYKAGDLATLRSLEVATRGMGADAESKRDELARATADELEIELAATQAQLKVLRDRLREIKSREPYALRTYLADTDWVLDTVAGLKREAEEQRSAQQAYDARYAALCGKGEK